MAGNTFGRIFTVTHSARAMGRQSVVWSMGARQVFRFQQKIFRRIWIVASPVPLAM